MKSGAGEPTAAWAIEGPGAAEATATGGAAGAGSGGVDEGRLQADVASTTDARRMRVMPATVVRIAAGRMARVEARSRRLKYTARRIPWVWGGVLEAMTTLYCPTTTVQVVP